MEENRSKNVELMALLDRLRRVDMDGEELHELYTMKESIPEIAHDINNAVNFVMSSVKVVERGVQDFTQLMSLYRELEGLRAHPDFKKIESFEADMDVDLTTQELIHALDIVYKGFERIQEMAHNISLLGTDGRCTKQEININDSIKYALAMVKDKLGKQIELKLDLQELPLVHSEKGKLNQVFANLIKNAVDAIAEKKDKKEEILAVSSQCVESEIVVKITDTGVGMTPETQEKVFDTFFTTKSPGKGTGLGMGVSKNIVVAHGGSIEVQSERGTGTEIRVRLPLEKLHEV